MPRIAVVICLVVMLTLALLTEVATGASLAFVLLDGGILFLATGAVPMIIWAFGRFTARNALAPIVIWGGILVLSCGGVYVYAVIVPAVTQAADQMAKDPKLKQQYRDAMIKSARESCLRREASAPPARAAAICDCESQRLADAVTPADLAAMLKGNGNAQQMGQKIRDAVEQCRRQ